MALFMWLMMVGRLLREASDLDLGLKASNNATGFFDGDAVRMSSPDLRRCRLSLLCWLEEEAAAEAEAAEGGGKGGCACRE
jgi:hypothetical protein